MIAQYWIAATLMGAGLGLILFGCVRARMHYGPILRERFGNGVRRVYWVVTIVLMVALANLALIGLRIFLGDELTPGYRLMMEIWFALLALLVAFALIFRRMRGRSNCD